MGGELIELIVKKCNSKNLIPIAIGTIDLQAANSTN
jgi:hypothetical protein